MNASTDDSPAAVVAMPDAPQVHGEAEVGVEVSVEAESDITVESAEVTFTAPVLGLEHLSRFALVSLHEESPLFSLQSLEDEHVRLIVLMPDAVYADYSPTFDAVSRAAVGLAGDEEGLLLVVVNARESLADSTVNLLAPILVNPGTGNAAQIVLTGTDYPLRAPIVL